VTRLLIRIAGYVDSPRGWQTTTIFASTPGDQLAIGASVVALALTMEQRPEGFGIPHCSLLRPAEKGPDAAIGRCRKTLSRDVARYALAALAGVHLEDYNLPCLTNQWGGAV
jgi:hypothetical protein